MLVLISDRTEELRLAGVRRDFVANVSHELKTPIGALTLLSEAIEAAADDRPDAGGSGGLMGADDPCDRSDGPAARTAHPQVRT